MWDIMITIFVICAVVLLWIILFDTNRFVVRRHFVCNPKILKPCRAVVLSDLHNKKYGKDNGILLSAIRDLQPDVILIAGDMVTSRKKAPTEDAVKLLYQLSEEFPIYYGVGNHEHRLFHKAEKYGSVGPDYLSALAEKEIVPICNSSKEIAECNIRIWGLDIEGTYYERFQSKTMDVDYVKGLLGEPDATCFNILLAHNPDYFPVYAGWGADLTVSGHVHGGIVKVPFVNKGFISPTFALFPKYDGGVFYEKGAQMVLSRGLGTHTLPVRVFNPGELYCIEFTPQE